MPTIGRNMSKGATAGGSKHNNGNTSSNAKSSLVMWPASSLVEPPITPGTMSMASSSLIQSGMAVGDETFDTTSRRSVENDRGHTNNRRGSPSGSSSPAAVASSAAGSGRSSSSSLFRKAGFGHRRLSAFSRVFLAVMLAQYFRSPTPAHAIRSIIGAQEKVNYRQVEKDILDKILGPGTYDSRIRPSGVNGTDGPAVVRINLYVRSIAKIDDVVMEYSVQLTFREEWLDERLKFNDQGGKIKYLTLTDPSRVWMPDLFFQNEKEGHFHKIILPNVYLRVSPGGNVLYSIRISLTLSCPMDLKLYPLDRQTCQLRMASYGWTTDDLVFLWKDGDPVQIVKKLHLPRFTLEKFFTDYCNSKTNTGEYSCLRVDLRFKREFSYYLLQIYIPTCMLVIVSWVSFWLDPSAVVARVSLGVTTLLTMATQSSSINASLPPVSYSKAIDVWTGACLTAVFGALLEYAFVNYASRLQTRRRKNKADALAKRRAEIEAAAMEAAGLDPEGPGGAFAAMPLMHHRSQEFMMMHNNVHCSLHVPRPRRRCFVLAWLDKFSTLSKKIDIVSRIGFPVLFAIFNFAYWFKYLYIEREIED